MRKPYLILLLLFLSLPALASMNPYLLGPGADSYSTDEISAYDGTDDGANQYLWTIGETRSQDNACLTENRCLLFMHYDENLDAIVDSNDSAKVVLLHRVGDEMRAASYVDLSISRSFGHNIVRLSDTRAMVVAEDGANDDLYVGLIGYDPDTQLLTELDFEVFGTTDKTFEIDADALDATTGVMAYSDNGVLGVRVADFTSDTITLGTEVNTLDDLNGACTQCYPAVCRITDTAFMTAADSVARYYTISGTTITEVDDVAIGDSSGKYEYSCARVDSDTGIIFYETASTFKANTASISGSTLTMGTAATAGVHSGGLGLYLQSGNVAYIDDGRVAITYNDSGGDGSILAFCDIDTGTNAITCATAVDMSTDNVQHPNISLFPDTMDNYLLFTGQNESTTPDKQIESRVVYTLDVDGSGAGSPISVSSLVGHVDATSSDSYQVGETWASLVDTDYDMYLGFAGTTDGDEPSFSGAGSTGVFTVDGGDYFNIAGSIPAEVHNVIDTDEGVEPCFVMAFELNDLGGDQGLFNMSKDASNQFWPRVEATDGELRIYHRAGGTTAADTYPGVQLAASTPYLLAICLNYSTDEVAYAVNSNTFTSYSVTNFGTGLASAVTEFYIGTDRALNLMRNGSTIKAFAVFADTDILSNADLDSICETLETEHNIDYDGDTTIGTCT